MKRCHQSKFRRISQCDIIETHGNEAIRQAAIRANQCEAVGDIDRSETWDHVMHAILEVTRTWRRDGEMCN